MRNFKRTLALVLAVLVVVGTFATVSAAEKKWYQPGIDYIQEIGVDTITPAKAEQKITRNDFVLWVAKIESHQLSENAWKDEIAGVDFTDVTDEHHKAAIAYSKQAKFIIGNGDGTFAPDKATTLGEAAAVIVRVMGYEDKVYDTSSENWAYNYMRAAQAYCYAFNDTFLANTDTYNPYYELTYGAAAYLLATIMNADGIDNESLTGTIVTADGINLGDYFVGKTLGVAEYTYYVVDMPRALDSTRRGAQADKAGANPLTFETNLLDTRDGKVVLLAPVNGGAMMTMPAAEFLKYVRVALGLPEQNDYMNEADEISVFAEVPLGSMVTIKTDRQNENAILNFDITVGDTNSVVVDTFVQATSLASNTDNYAAKYLGWHAASVGDTNNFLPVLPTSYTEELATSWTNLVYNEDETAIISATLNFKGVEYTVAAKDADIDVLNADYEVLSADEAVKTLVNAAQGSVYAVFNDIDFDGDYDTVVVYKSELFKVLSGANNIKGNSTTLYPYITALSNGETVKDEDGNEIMLSPKGNAVGGVMFNAQIDNPNAYKEGTEFLDEAWSSLCDDTWFYNFYGATGKVQMVIAAPDGNGVFGDNINNFVFPVYKLVDLAEFASGLIEEIDAFTLEDYFIAKIRLADQSLKTVYIPVTPEEKTTFEVTIGGATAEYTLDSSAWCTLLAEAVEATAKELGIVSGVLDEEHKAATAAWLAGKYVDFAVNEEGVAIALLGTDKATGVSGFVTNVANTSDNVYNVTIATSGENVYGNATKYMTEILAKNVGESTPYSSASSIDDAYASNSVNPDFYLYYSATGNGKDYLIPVTDDATGAVVSYTLMKRVVDEENSTYDADGNRVTTVYKYVERARTEEGYLMDNQGKTLIASVDTYAHRGVAGVKTVEVRASASSIFDWANYNVYNAVFTGSLIDPNHGEDGKVEPEKDLIYVEVIEDAGSSYLKYVPYTSNPVADKVVKRKDANDNGPALKQQMYDSGSWWAYWYYPEMYKVDATAENSWTEIESGHIIDMVEIDVIHEGLHEDTGLVDRTAIYNAVVGYKPYFERVFNNETKAYEYEIKYTEVRVYENVIGYQAGVIDTTKTLMTELYYGGTGIATTQVKVTEETKDIYTLANGYFVDDNGYVYLLHKSAIYENGYVVEYKKDKEGKYIYAEIDYTSFDGQPYTPMFDIALKNVDEEVEALLNVEEIAEVSETYATLGFEAKKSGDKGYYPGTAYFVVDGVKFSLAPNAPVVLVTPSAHGFATVTYTAKEIVDKKIEFFATEWNATFDAENNMFGIALLGTYAGIEIKDDMASEDDDPVVTPDTQIVYLNKSAKAVIRAAANNEGWMVISDESAIALPSGESVGQIYRVYSTYAEAKANEINLSIKGDNYYEVDKDCKIVGAKAVEVKVGVITSENAAGKTMADMNIYDNAGKITGEDVSALEFAWYYRDVDGNLVKAGNSKNVAIIDQTGFGKLVEKLVKARDDAEATLEVKTEIYEAGNLSQTKYDYYKAEYEAAEAALEAALIANTDKYYNGQFWGFANSPYYAYVQMGSGSFQQEASDLYFQYIEVDGVYCVFSDTYTFTAPAK